MEICNQNHHAACILRARPTWSTVPCKCLQMELPDFAFPLDQVELVEMKRHAEEKALAIPCLNLMPHEEGTGYAGQKSTDLESSDPTFPWPQLSQFRPATAVRATLPRKSKVLSAAFPKPSMRSWFHAFFQAADISHWFF